MTGLFFWSWYQTRLRLQPCLLPLVSKKWGAKILFRSQRLETTSNDWSPWWILRTFWRAACYTWVVRQWIGGQPNLCIYWKQFVHDRFPECKLASSLKKQYCMLTKQADLTFIRPNWLSLVMFQKTPCLFPRSNNLYSNLSFWLAVWIFVQLPHRYRPNYDTGAPVPIEVPILTAFGSVHAAVDEVCAWHDHSFTVQEPLSDFNHWVGCISIKSIPVCQLLHPCQPTTTAAPIDGKQFFRQVQRVEE